MPHSRDVTAVVLMEGISILFIPQLS